MGIFDRGAKERPAGEAPAESEPPDENEGEGTAIGQGVEEPAEEGGPDDEAEPEEPTGPTYVPYDRRDPPQRIRDRFGDGGKGGEDVLDVFDAYATADGQIREDVLELPREHLEEWADIDQSLGGAKYLGQQFDAIIEDRTVDVNEELPEDEFFRTAEGFQTLANRYDLEKAVPFEKKRHFTEVNRYWVNKPYAYVLIFHSTKENETKYYVIEPYLTPIEEEVKDFLSEKLRAAIKYETDDVLADDEENDQDVRANVIDRETRRLLKRFDLYAKDTPGEGSSSRLGGLTKHLGPLASKFGVELGEDEGPTPLEGLSVRPEPAILEEDSRSLSEYQVEKLLYYLKRDFVGYERIDGIKHDINVEDISCDGYNSPVFVYHTDHENIISNVYHGEDELDEFVVKLAQRSGKGISKRTPQVDATLPDGSRAQLTLGQEVSDHGTNYTIRQFKDVPFTPVDLINWRTFSLDQMAFLWLAIENNKSLIFAGGTASGKTTSLNAVSLFIPSNAKIVSIEDTREVELPQRNWIASVTRPSFSDDDQGDIDEFDLLEAALRQRPDYIVMGEIRGEEGRTLFQVMSTGHTTYTTFHADTVGEVLKRFTTEPINVSKTLFTALDLVSIQRQTRVKGRKVRRSASITEINEYNAENDEINVKDVYQWRAETDEFERLGQSNLIEQIMFDRGWSAEELEEQIQRRRVVLAYLIEHGLNEYAQVAATLQAFMSDPETLLTLIAHDALASSLSDLREMESVLIDIDPEKEALVPRPDPPEDIAQEAATILQEAEGPLLAQYRENVPETGAIGRMLKNARQEAEPIDQPAIQQGIGDVTPTIDEVVDEGDEPTMAEEVAQPARPGLEASDEGAPDGATTAEAEDAELPAAFTRSTGDAQPPEDETDAADESAGEYPSGDEPTTVDSSDDTDETRDAEAATADSEQDEEDHQPAADEAVSSAVSPPDDDISVDAESAADPTVEANGGQSDPAGDGEGNDSIAGLFDVEDGDADDRPEDAG